jgi:hypothetical protein
MSTNFQAIYDTLGKIQTTLGGLKEQGVEVPQTMREQLGGGLNTLSGVVSSEQARRSVSNAQSNSGVSPGPDPLTVALQAQAKAEAEAKKATERAKEAEATASISDQRMLAKQKVGAGGVTDATTPPSPGAVTLANLLASEPTLADYGLTEDNVNDPMVVASLRFQVAREGQIAKDVEALNKYVANKEQRVRDQIALIDQSIANQSEQLKIEQRKRMAATGMAGVLSGRSLYSPEEHQGLIQEVVQEGILQLQQIQIEGFKLKNEMLSDFEDFQFEAYTKKSEMLSELNKLELQTVTTIQERLQDIAKQQREKTLFDQSQADRNAFILAPELMNASPEEIMRVAQANGIEAGVLKRAIDDYAFQQDDRNLSLQAKRESILTSQQSRRLALAKDAGSKTDEPMSPSVLKAFTDLYGLREGKETASLIPPYWSENDLRAFMQDNPNVPASDIKSAVTMWETSVIASQIEDPVKQKEFITSSLEKAGLDYPTVSKRVESKIIEDHAEFFSAAKTAGVSSKFDLRGKKGDVKAWVGTPTIQAEIRRLYERGLTQQQIIDELVSLYGQ